MDDERLALLDSQGGYGEITADWETPDMTRRIRGGRKQPLSRAAGLHKHRASLLDGCAGLGRDGAVLAALGARVTMIERHPVVYALLEDAWGRSIYKNSIVPRHAAAQDFLAQQLPGGQPDVVYLDPMYPDNSKKSLPAKALQALRNLLDDGPEESGELLELALACARRRVVVKRPRRIPPLTDLKPDFSYTGQQTRYDVYLVG